MTTGISWKTRSQLRLAERSLALPGVAIICASLLLAASCSDSGDEQIDDTNESSGVDSGVYSADGVGETSAEAMLQAPDGADMGSAEFQQAPTGVLITVRAEGLTPGWHGIHLHSVAACSPDFAAAGGHINPSGAEGLHGLLKAEPDADGNRDHGDLPNLYAAPDGTAQAEFFTTLVTISGGSMPALLDDDGSAIVIHENRDDHMSQPIGGAGGRVACGVIQGM